jgi:hypothetical protein
LLHENEGVLWLDLLFVMFPSVFLGTILGGTDEFAQILSVIQLALPYGARLKTGMTTMKPAVLARRSMT